MLDECLDGPPGAGDAVATYWQGTLTWWGFDPREPVTTHVERELTRFVTTLPALGGGARRSVDRRPLR